MRKKLLAIFSALLMVCSLGAVGMSVSAEQDVNKTAIAPDIVVWYDDQIGGSGTPGITVGFGEDITTHAPYWATINTDKVSYRDQYGNNKLTIVESCGNSFAIRNVTPELHDVLTVYAGFTWNGKEVKYDFAFHYDGVANSPWYGHTASGVKVSSYVYNTALDSNKTELAGMVVEHSASWGSAVINFETNHPDLDAYVNLVKGGMGKEFLEIDKSLISYTDKDGNDKLFSLRLYQNKIFVDAGTTLGGYQEGDILTIKSGFVWGDYQAKKDLVFVCQGENATFAPALDNFTNKNNVTINSLNVYSEYGAGNPPAIQINLDGTGSVFATGQNYASTMNIIYTSTNNVVKPISEFTAVIDSGSFRFSFEDASYRLQVGDIFVIKAGSFISVGTTAFVFPTDVAYQITDPNSETGYQVYTLSPCTVTFDLAGGTLNGSSSVVVSEGTPVARPADPTKAATAQYTFAFAGWYLNNVEYDFSKSVTESITLVAKWTETLRSYTVTFNSNGGTTVTSQTKKYGEFFTEPTAPTKAETTTKTYEFAGWTLDGEPYNFATTQVTGDILLVATWNEVPKTFTVTYNSNGGTAVAPETVAYGTCFTEPADPTKEADENYTYTFAGWTLGGQVYDFSTTATRNITLIAQWTQTPIGGGDPVDPTTYTVTFNSNGGTAVAMQTINANATATRPADPTKAADANYTYTFAGWYLNNVEYNFATPVTGNIILVAKWTQTPVGGGDPVIPTTYTVTFNSNGGTAVSSQTIDENATATRPADPTKDADANYTYTFAGWYLDNVEYNFATPVTGNITLVAKWTQTPVGGGDPVDPPVDPSTYTVTFNSVGGTTVASQTINANATATRPTDPTKAEDAEYTYTFGGWLLDGVAYDFATPVTENITLVANWIATRKAFNVTFDANGGTLSGEKVVLVAKGEKVTKPIDPVRAESLGWTFTFAGWTLDGVDFNFETAITGDITLVAKWTAISPEAPDLDEGFPENPEDGEFEEEMNKGVGCGSIVGSTLIPSMVALLGAGIVVARKRKQK
ncbi:MAG: hypothetical protein E7362_01300 [Clostridiales bacterium]|nr:hypothetical protein [Clostridiales bacterium]